MFFIQVVCGHPGGRLQFSKGGSKMAWLASAFSSIRATCPNKVRRWDLMMDDHESGGWLVIWRMSAFLTKSCQQMSRILRSRHWSTASIRCISALPSIQIHKALSGVWRPCTGGVWSCSLSMTSTSVNLDSALLIVSWNCACDCVSQDHCYRTSES